jgi:hypothetical protein
MNISHLLAQNPLDGTITAPGPFQPSGGTGAESGGAPLELIFSVLMGFLTVLGGLMFLVYFIFAGLSWITASGDKGKIDKSKTQMTNSVIGLAIMLVSQAIVGIVGAVLGLDILNPVKMLGQLWM